MTYALGDLSRQRLVGLHPDLIKVVERAIQISECDFAVLEGVRALARQEKLVKAGASQTLKSRHLTGHAVDLGAMVNGSVRWDWPLYDKVAAAMKAAAAELKIPLEWGGDWTTLKDGPHFQLPWSAYP
jgi:peptidoglycan LD-endopeptidase CwlK